MKRLMLCAMTGGLLIGTGCSKKEEAAAPQTTPPAEKAKTVEQPAPASQKASITTTTEGLTKQVNEQAGAVVSAVTVKAQDVMEDLNQSVEAVRKKAGGLDTAQLLAYADQYKTILLEKKDQIAALTDQVKALPMTELMGDKAKALKDQLSQYTAEFGALKDRYTVYLDKLKELGVDLSAYAL